MHFCNMMGKGFTELHRYDGSLFTVSDERLYDTDLVVDDKIIRVIPGNGANNIFNLEHIFDGRKTDDLYIKNLKMNLSIADVMDSVENPLVICLCSELGFFADVPAVVRYVSINDEMMLVCLIAGAIAVKDADGSFIPMYRCFDGDCGEVVWSTNAKGLHSSMLPTKYSSYSYCDASVVTLHFMVSNMTLTTHVIDEYNYVFFQALYDKIKAYEAKKAQYEEERKRQKEAEELKMREEYALLRQQMQEAEELAARQKAEKEAAKLERKRAAEAKKLAKETKKKNGAADSDKNTVDVSPASFLEAVKRMKEGRQE